MRFSDPQKNIKKFGLLEGTRVADFGSGSGHYTLVASLLVGNSGRVYAIDIQKELLKKVKDISSGVNQDNIDVLCGDIEEIDGTKLADESVNAVLITNVLFQIEKKENVAVEAFRVLKKKGRILFVDWTDSFGGIGPQPDDVVSEENAKALFEDAGFQFSSRFDAGAHHYGLIFKKI